LSNSLTVYAVKSLIHHITHTPRIALGDGVRRDSG